MQRACKTIVSTKKYYSSEDGFFYVEKSYSNNTTETKRYKEFTSFYKSCGGDLTNADLLDWRPKGIDISQYSFKGAIITSDLMIGLGSYNGGFYDEIVASLDNFNVVGEMLPSRIDYRIMPLSQKETEIGRKLCVFYISDLHLDYKLLKKYPIHANEFEIQRYLDKTIKSLKDSYDDINNSMEYTESLVIIAGDISNSFELNKWFFQSYIKTFSYLKTFFILGNHEFKDKMLLEVVDPVRMLTEKYKKLFQELSANLYILQNELYIPYNNTLLGYDAILSAEKALFDEIWKYNPYAIFGGTGFSGLNNGFNANSGIYGNAKINREVEIKESKRVEALHEKLKDLCPNKKVLFVTHMPKENWTLSANAENWLYFSGHTHRNVFSKEESFFADNQIGFYRESFGFKFVITSSDFNPFFGLRDGVHEIEKIDYLQFYRGMGKLITFRRQYEKLFLIKKNGIYMFFVTTSANKKYKLLDGGFLKNTNFNDLSTVYNNIETFVFRIKERFSNYEKEIKDISTEIKRIGGSGTIHGCIVDIDADNHVFYNPYDGGIYCYWARSIKQKILFKSFLELIQNTPYLNCRIEKALVPTSSRLYIENADLNTNMEWVEDTSLYRASKMFYKIQQLLDQNVLRFWSNNVFDGLKLQSSNNGRKEEKDRNLLRLTKKAKKYHEIYLRHQSIIDRLTNCGFEVLSFINAHKEATYKCKRCGFEFVIIPKVFKTDYNLKCPNCKCKE